MIIREERIGGQRLILGDCLGVMPLLGRFDAVVTDPPYGIGFPYASYDDTASALVDLVKDFMPLCRGLSSRLIVTPGTSNIWKYPEADWVGSWTWGTTSTYGRLGYSQWQPILFYGADVKGFGSINGVLKSDRIQVGGWTSRDSKTSGGGHTCPKPLSFVEALIRRFTLDDETILDPFMGSGTTLVACQRLGRQGTGIELDPDYFDIACKRVDEATRQPDMFVSQAAPAPTQGGFDL